MSPTESLSNRPYTYGGASTVSYELAKSMANRNHQVVVFTSSSSFKTSEIKNAKITLHRYGTICRVLTANITPNIFLSPIKHNVDLVHAHFSIFPAADAGLLYSKVKKKPLVITYHSDNNLNYGPFLRKSVLLFYNKSVLDEILSHAKAIITPSLRILENSQTLKPYAHKIVQIPNGVENSVFDIPNSKEECRKTLNLSTTGFIILFVGALTKSKGLQILIKTMPQIIKAVPETKLIIAGEGYHREKLEQLASNLGVDKHVQFVGLLRKSLPLYMKSSDVFTLPSFQENFPVAILEAMAAGIPVIASRVGGIKDIITDGKTGLLLEPGDVDGLTEAILRIHGDEYLSSQMSKEAQKLVESYSWERVAEETEKLYLRVLSNDY